MNTFFAALKVPLPPMSRGKTKGQPDMSRDLLSTAYEDARKGGVFPMFTVYKNPIDHPGKFVVRMHIVLRKASRPTDTIGIADDLAGVRAMLPRGLVCQPRDPRDEKQIVETWF